MENDVTRRKFLGVGSAVVAVGAAAPATLAHAKPQETGSGAIKIVGICCSFREGRSTVTAMQMCLEAAKQFGAEHVEVELIDLAGMKIDGRPSAGVDLEPGQQDDFPGLVPRLSDPNVGGIIIGTPVYFGNMTSLCKAFLERCMTFRKGGFALGGKVGGVLAVGGGRDGGQELTIQSVQAALFCQNMILVGEAQPSSHSGAAVWNNGDDFAEDELNKATTESLGRRVAEVALQLNPR